MQTKQKASIIAMSAALTLAVLKFTAGALSGSMAVLSSGLDSLLDVFMSFMNFLAIRKADAPPDYNHHYGHGKIEDLAAVGQSLVITGTGITIVYRAFATFFDGSAIKYSFVDGGVMLVSIAASGVIASVLRRIGEQTNSNTLKADALHYSSDLFSNTAALIAIGITYVTGLVVIDLLFAVVVGVIIIASALRIVKSALYGLTDASIPDSVRRAVDEIIEAMPMPYAGYHKLRTRSAGSRKYIDFHLLVCRTANVNDAHDMAETIESRIKERIEQIDVMIHIEPCPYTCEMTEATCRVLKMRRNGTAA